MDQNNHKNEYDLEKRTTEFAKKVIRLCKSVPRNPINDRITGQLTGSAGSVGANYREANDALGRKDFFNRIKISRKEAKESVHWLECLAEANDKKYSFEINECICEAIEFKKIFSSIAKKDV